MKKPIRSVAIIIGLLLTGALLYWQFNKDTIVENAIEKNISKKTDSLYYIKYDSSAIDALQGNASFYNVRLQSDSVQEKINDADAADNVMYNVRVGEVSVKGVNIPGLLAGSNLEARSIEIIRPDIQIIRTGDESDNSLTRNDSIALYEKMLGKFKSIKASEIIIRDGNVSFANKNNVPQTTLKNIDLTLHDFKIDSTKDYANLVSYFVKGVVTSVEEITTRNAAKNVLQFHNVTYDAGKQVAGVARFQQKKSDGTVIYDLNNISINGLSTNIFINNQQLVANELSTSGGSVMLYKKGTGKDRNIILDSSFFDRASLNKISIGKTRVSVYDKEKPAAAPVVINNVEFKATDIPAITSGNSLKNIIANSKWILSGDGLSYNTDDNVYKISFGAFLFNTASSLITVNGISLQPRISEAEFVKRLKVQKDFADIRLNNVVVNGADIKKLVAEKTFLAESISLQPIIKIFNDRTVPRNLQSKVPTDPAKFLKGIEQAFKINALRLNNGYLSYRERGRLSAQTGQLFFEKLNAVITNVTNIPSAYNQSPDLILNATASFMGKAGFNTKWTIPLNSAKGDFRMTGKLNGFEGFILNAALEPQAMLSVRKGNVNSFVFNSRGDETTIHTTSTILYNGLKLDILEKDASKNDLDKKDATSFVANIIIRDENPHNGTVRTNEVDYPRDPSRSFFYLASQSFFLSIRKSITGKNNAK